MKIEKVPEVRTIQNVIETLHRKAKSMPRIYTPQYMHLVPTNKTDRHDIAELLLEVALNIIIHPPALNDL
jgi:hypothetical protein